MSLETQAAFLALAAAVGWFVALVAVWLAFHSSRALWMLGLSIHRHNAAHSREWCCDLERLLFTKAAGRGLAAPAVRRRAVGR